MLLNELLPKEVRKQIPPLNSNENVSNRSTVVKLYNPYLNWNWYIIEGEEVEDDYVFFGYAEKDEKGFGYFTLRDVTSCIGVERDLNYKPEPLEAIKGRSNKA